jgi:hypothetical protein
MLDNQPQIHRDPVSGISLNIRECLTWYSELVKWKEALSNNELNELNDFLTLCTDRKFSTSTEGPRIVHRDLIPLGTVGIKIDRCTLDLYTKGFYN